MNKPVCEDVEELLSIDDVHDVPRFHSLNVTDSHEPSYYEESQYYAAFDNKSTYVL
jgi:hypothetical protein